MPLLVLTLTLLKHTIALLLVVITLKYYTMRLSGKLYKLQFEFKAVFKLFFKNYKKMCVFEKLNHHLTVKNYV